MMPAVRERPARLLPLLPLSGLLLFFLGMCLPFLNRPLDTWEWMNHAAAREVARRGIPATDGSNNLETLLVVHPPSGAYAAGAGMLLFGENPGAARFPGAVIVCLTSVVLFCLTKRLAEVLGLASAGRAIALSAAGLYLGNPATVHGGLYLGFSEGTFLPLCVTLFAYAYARAAGRPLMKAAGPLGALFNDTRTKRRRLSNATVRANMAASEK